MNSVESICCICSEGYDEAERKPLVLPCSHTFCESCLLQVQATDMKVCPICRSDWSEHSVDSFIYIRQLVPSAHITKEVAKRKPNDICGNHAKKNKFWCNLCEISICEHCLKDEHKQCDWISEEEKTEELKKILQEKTQLTRTGLVDFFSHAASENVASRRNVWNLIRKLQVHEKSLLSLEKFISAEKDTSMKLLEEFENIPVHSSVVEYTSAISKTISLLDDVITFPNFPSLSLHAEYKETASSELTDSTKCTKEFTHDVCIIFNTHCFCSSIFDTNEVSVIHNLVIYVFCLFFQLSTIIEKDDVDDDTDAEDAEDAEDYEDAEVDEDAEDEDAEDEDAEDEDAEDEDAEDEDAEDSEDDKSDFKWTVTSSSGLLSVSGRLHTEQPQKLEVNIPGDVSTPALTQFFQVIQKEFTGSMKFKLWKSYLEYDKCDPSLAVFPYFE